MNNNDKPVDISDGIEINSLTSYSAKNNDNSDDESTGKINTSFNDLEETNFEEKINLKNKSDIDSIEFTGKDDFFSEIFIKNLSTSNKNKKQEIIENSNVIVDLKTEEISDNTVTKKKEKGTTTKNTKTKDNAVGKEKIEKTKNKKQKEKKTKNIDDPDENKTPELIQNPKEEIVENLETVEEDVESAVEVVDVEEAEEVEEVVVDERFNEITTLINKINKEKDTVEFPGKIDLIKIDKKLSNPELEIEEETAVKTPEDTEEVFGIKRAEVYYTIDKKIYSSRRSQKSVITKIKNLKNGMFLPSMVAAISFFVLFVAIPLTSFYLKKGSASTLEENYITDNSILSRIAKQKEEEARLSRLDLEQKMKSLEFEKNKIESSINEELIKRRTEIENDYKKKLLDIENRSISPKQMDLLKQQLEDDKSKALDLAKTDSGKKLDEQQKILDQKNKELLDADTKLSNALKNKDFEITKVTKSLEDALKEKDLEAQSISQKLLAMSENNKKVKEFNQMVYQMIVGAIDDFKNERKDPALAKLDNVIKYYNSRLEFINANEDLSSKMSTDFAFIQTIARLIQDSKNSMLYDEELVKTINKFKKITEYYKNAENSYNKRDYLKSSEEYVKVLNEIDEVNSSYNRLKLLEKQIQNAKAVGFYNQAIDDMKNFKYDLAMQELASVIRDTPISDYATQALGDMVTLSNTLSASSKTAKSNEQAKEAYAKANDYSKNKLYKEAINTYQNVIINYPYSDYTKDSLKNIIDLQSILSQSEFKKLDDKLRENFRSDYNKYIELSRKGNIEDAREYYFSALKNAFNIYTDGSIPEFKSNEDKYITSLLDTTRLSNNAALSKQIEDAKTALSKQYNGDLEKMKKQYDDQLALIKKENTTSNIKTSQEELNKLKEFYETELSKKNKEIEKINNDLKNSDNTSTTVKTSQENLNKLKEYYETELNKKNKEIEKINNDLKNLVNTSTTVKTSQENLNKLKEYYETELNKKNKEIEKINNDLKNSANTSTTVKTSQEELNKLKEFYETELNKKNKEIEKINNDLKNLVNTSTTVKTSQENLNKLKEYYETELNKKNKEIEKINNDLKNSTNTSIANNENQLKTEKENVTKLKQQLFDLYKKYGELEQSSKKVDTSTAQGQLSNLQKKYQALQAELDDSRIILDAKINDIEKKSKDEIKKQVDIEKEKLKKEFADQLSIIKTQNGQINTTKKN